MASVFSVRNAARLYGAVLRREIHSSRSRHAITEFGMPAMSPTMTEGGIASWKKKEGESFEAGDILLEIETDKATIDVEAQEDGVLGKIILGDGTKNVPVGKVIAILAEEGDDISNIEISEKVSSPQPKNVDPPSPIEPSSPPSLASQSFHEPNHKLPFHSRPLFPSVQRLVLQNRLLAHDLRSIKGTGVRGMLTKGDILAHIGKASSPWGTSKGPKEKQEISSPQFLSQYQRRYDYVLLGTRVVSVL
ncbi:single hybrid motif-containing protein [Cantharellus anzutake]|uniref:single hybrid motif-containing protein n=1 Tax=Cantharellus anzutake TaxID=1750568 RepID=UPI0019060D76|nr:single hybrid motif-containing protein [Cantharellus anzutake]KAF8334036.1 single hybrid motif-containing protein [Cantharellus anzutake]